MFFNYFASVFILLIILLFSAREALATAMILLLIALYLWLVIY